VPFRNVLTGEIVLELEHIPVQERGKGLWWLVGKGLDLPSQGGGEGLPPIVINSQGAFGEVKGGLIPLREFVA